MVMPKAMSGQAFDVSAAFALLSGGEEAICLKIASSQVEVNDGAKLAAILDAVSRPTR